MSCRQLSFSQIFRNKSKYFNHIFCDKARTTKSLLCQLFPTLPDKVERETSLAMGFCRNNYNEV